MSTDGAAGQDKVRASAADGFFVITPGQGAPATLKVGSGQWDITVADEYNSLAVRHPLNPNGQLYAEGHRNVTRPAVSGPATLVVEAVTDPDAIVIVKPLSASFLLGLQNEGSYSLQAVDEQLLERSHFYSQNGTTTSANDYEYVARDTLAMSVAGRTTVQVTGDFQVYFWGLDLALENGGSIERIQTGYHGTQVAAGVGPWAGVWEDHYVYATATVLGATLTYETSEGPAQVYSPSITIESKGETQLTGTAGEIPGQDGQYVVQGQATIGDASFVGSRSEDGQLRIDFNGPPSSVDGDSAVFQPSPWSARAWFWPTLGLAFVLLALASVWMAPTVAGRMAKSHAFLGHAPAGYREGRAVAYFNWALAAETKGHIRRAAYWMGRAAKAAPDNAEAWRELGTFLRAGGKPVQALDAHLRAHRLLEVMPDSYMAHNAYEAARAASLAGRPGEAMEWLRLAVESEPYLAEDAAKEPDFASLRSLPDYQSLTGPALL